MTLMSSETKGREQADTEALSLHEKRILSAANLLAGQQYVPQRQIKILLKRQKKKAKELLSEKKQKKQQGRTDIRIGIHRIYTVVGKRSIGMVFETLQSVGAMLTKLCVFGDAFLFSFFSFLTPVSSVNTF